MKRYTTIIVERHPPKFLILVVISTLCCGFAGVASSSAESPPSIPAQSADTQIRPPVWISEAWTANDKPFIVARNQIEKYVKTGHDPLKLVAKYEILAQKKPGNVDYVYQWGTALFWSSLTKPRTWKPETADRLLMVFMSIPSPHSMQYDRMRFLIEALYQPNPNLKPLLLRLLQYEPHDDQVKGSALRVLRVWNSADDSQLALRYMRDLIAKHPKDPTAYARLAAVYYDMAFRTDRRSNMLNSIAYYQKYLAFAKSNDPFRERAKYLISVLQKTLPSQ